MLRKLQGSHQLIDEMKSKLEIPQPPDYKVINFGLTK